MAIASLGLKAPTKRVERADVGRSCPSGHVVVYLPWVDVGDAALGRLSSRSPER